MSRIQLRAFRSAEEERALYGRTYPTGYRHDVWPDHVERVAASVEMIRQYSHQIVSVADLSCGDAAIVRGLVGMKRLRTAYLGDLNGVDRVPEDGWDRVRTHRLSPGPLPDTLTPDSFHGGMVDLFVLSETLEHMEDPDGLLSRIRGAARYLFLSTPLLESPDSGNLEHYWSWGQDDLHQMLLDAGWSPVEYQRLTPLSTRHLEHAYTYQLWMAVRS